MPLRNNLPVKFKPQTVCDTWDGMNVTPGAMSSLSNLIPDPSTPMAFQCRPAASVITTFPSGSFPGAGTVSVAFEINNRVYGLISSTLHAGYDQPFSYNLIANTFDTITGITSSNVPTTQATTGAWTPPAVAVMGPYVIFTHPGFNGSGNGYFGYFNITNPSSPAWASGNTTGNGLTGVPTDVQLFYNRLYFAVGNTLQFTDTLSLNRTNTSQSLTAGDTSSITALSLFTLTTL